VETPARRIAAEAGTDAEADAPLPEPGTEAGAEERGQS
jgi:hypothetical protein